MLMAGGGLITPLAGTHLVNRVAGALGTVRASGQRSSTRLNATDVTGEGRTGPPGGAFAAMIQVSVVSPRR
jgi:hypothetical protein